MASDILDLSDLNAKSIGLEPGTNYIAGERPNAYDKKPEFRGGVSPIFWDVETKPLPLGQILAICGEFPPLEPYQEPPAFDPESVKIDHLVDKTKIAAKIEKARAKYEADAKYARENHEKTYAKKKAEYEAKLIEDAALHAHMSQPLAIGYLRHEFEREAIIHAVNEVDLIKAFWNQFTIASDNHLKLVGANILDFDLPYLLRRSWMLGITVPVGVFAIKGGRMYFNDLFVDVRSIWLCNQHWGKTESGLDHIDRCFGGPGKGKLDGSMFHRLWDEDHETAVGYLTNDLEMLQRAWERMGL